MLSFVVFQPFLFSYVYDRQPINEVEFTCLCLVQLVLSSVTLVSECHRWSSFSSRVTDELFFFISLLLFIAIVLFVGEK